MICSNPTEKTAAMKNILVPTDFSTHANAALDTAVSIARKTGALVHLYHVIELPDIAGMQEIMARREAGGEETPVAADSRLHNLVGDEACSDIHASYSLDYGTPWKNITGKAEEEGFDMVVIGSHGMSRIDKIVFGSTTAQVIRHAHCPVLAVHDTICCFSPSNIVFGAGVPAKKTEGLDALKSFTSLYNATLHLVKVSTREYFECSRQSRTLMESFADLNGLRQYTVNCYNDESIGDGILHFAEDIGADMLCMPIHGASGLSRLVRKSLAEKVEEQVVIPVLTCRLPEE